MKTCMELSSGTRILVGPAPIMRKGALMPETKFGRIIVSDSYKIGLTVCALFVAASSAASAADLGKGPNAINGIVTQSTCGTLSPTLKQGTNTLSNILYGGPGAKATLASPGTSSTGKPGSASTSVCVATTATPSAGLNGATITFNCYGDTLSGPAASPQAKIKATFKIGASHDPSVKQINTVSSLFLGASPTPTCSFTTDGTAVLE
jgi:hypothetical protein